MLWRIGQITIFTTVLFSNVKYQWTPNGYAAGLVAFFVTLFFTAIPIMISDLVRTTRRLSGWLYGLVRAADRSPAVHSQQHPSRDSRRPPAGLDYPSSPAQDGT